jgi:branched-chain amino acid transport system ATP-binding protein
MAGENLLELRDIAGGYGATKVLFGVDLEVPRGGVVALVGANGAGKTTLLRIASGLLRPASGTVRLAGQDVTRKPPHERAKLGLCHVTEGRSIFRALTVRDNLELQVPPWVKDTSLDRAIEMFPVLGDRLNQTAGSMSGGEQQMLALARAWVAEPSLVLVDEASMGLAPRIVQEIFEVLRRLAEAGVALLLVEQYVARALELADHVYLLKQGTITYSGSPSGLADDALLSAYLGGDEPPANGTAHSLLASPEGPS